MLEATVQTALTDELYWDKVWNFNSDHATEAAPSVERGPTTEWIDASIGAHLRPGRRFLEIGVGGSPWLAHVAEKYGAEAWGIDFSRPGLELAARAVTKDRHLVRLIEGDVFDRSKLPSAAFDVVYSGGFVEHFPSPQPLMERLAELLTPGGVLVTAVPNLCGLNGALQKLVDVETFERHVVISPARLDAAHASGGMVPVKPASFLGVLDPSAVNYSRLAVRMPPLMLRSLQFSLAKLRHASEWLGGRTGTSGGRWLAPMLGGVYQRSR